MPPINTGPLVIQRPTPQPIIVPSGGGIGPSSPPSSLGGGASPFGGIGRSGKPPIISSPFQGFGAGQGPVQATGQQADNPFQNTFNFQIPTGPAMGAPADNSSQMAAPSSPGASNGGYSQYLPLVIVGVIVAGIGYFAFGGKK